MFDSIRIFIKKCFCMKLHTVGTITLVDITFDRSRVNVVG